MTVRHMLYLFSRDDYDEGHEMAAGRLPRSEVSSTF